MKILLLCEFLQQYAANADRVANFCRRMRIINEAPPLPPCLAVMLQKMQKTFQSPLNMTLQKVDIQGLKRDFRNFDAEMNQRYHNCDITQFQKDVEKMPYATCYELGIDSKRVYVRFLSSKPDYAVKVTLLLAINCFLSMYTHRWLESGLRIDICLSDNLRLVSNYPSKQSEIPVIMKKLCHKSMALNVSGLTNKMRNLVVLTRKQEILKLLFHELTHYVGLDIPLRSNEYDGLEFHAEEAFTEWLSVVFVTAFQTIWSATCPELCGIPQEKIYACYLYLESEYAICLSAKVVKFCYPHSTNATFRFEIGPALDMARQAGIHIAIWEYVVLKTQLWLAMPAVLACLNADLAVENKQALMAILHQHNAINKVLHQELGRNLDGDFAYTVSDLDYAKLVKPQES